MYVTRPTSRAARDASRNSVLQIPVLDAVLAAHLLHHQLGVRAHLELGHARSTARRKPATSAEYSATLFVAMPIASPRASSTVPSSASRT